LAKIYRNSTDFLERNNFIEKYVFRKSNFDSACLYPVLEWLHVKISKTFVLHLEKLCFFLHHFSTKYFLVYLKYLSNIWLLQLPPWISDLLFSMTADPDEARISAANNIVSLAPRILVHELGKKLLSLLPDACWLRAHHGLFRWVFLFTSCYMNLEMIESTSLSLLLSLSVYVLLYELEDGWEHVLSQLLSLSFYLLLSLSLFSSCIN